MAFVPSSIAFRTRPEWLDEWKAIGSSSTCSKKFAMVESRLRWASRSECSAIATPAPMVNRPNTTHAMIQGASAVAGASLER